LIGGYFALQGKIDVGQLVAVIAAYKDLPSPIKELIDWDQQRLDVEVKFAQVVEQFDIEDMLERRISRRLPDGRGAWLCRSRSS
jgi:putative ABC transport system ATP-binding protein